jgi:hypothetical protein
MKLALNNARGLLAPLLAVAIAGGVCSTVRAQARPTEPQPAAAVGTEPPVDRKALIASGVAPDLFLLSTGDVIGYLDPCG